MGHAMVVAVFFGVVLSLATLLGILVHLSIGQRNAILAIRALGGTVHFFDDDRIVLGRLKHWIGSEYVGRVQWVELSDTKVTDDELVCMQQLLSVSGIRLSYTSITDRGLNILCKLKKPALLDWIMVTDARVTNKGIVHLRKALPNVDIVWSQFSDRFNPGESAGTADSGGDGVASGPEGNGDDSR